MIGINKALELQTGVNSGVGFAVASNTIRQVVPYLIEDGKFVYPYLGMSAVEEISLAMQQALQPAAGHGRLCGQRGAGRAERPGRAEGRLGAAHRPARWRATAT